MAYLQSWVSRSREDKTLILYASTRAFKAGSFVLNLKAEAEKEAPLSGNVAS